MDLKSKKGDYLKDFLVNNELKNFVSNYTRVCTNYYKKLRGYSTTKSLIDVIIHNQDKIIETKVFGCPFSDHSFVLTSLDFKADTSKPNNSTYGRSLTAKNLLLINEELAKVDFSTTNNCTDVNQQWNLLKGKILDVIDKIAPVKEIKVKPKELFPWEDAQLHEARKLRDYYFSLSKQNHSFDDLALYKQFRSEYQTLNRTKMKAYFATKSTNDFKNSKKFWQFYSASIRVKSDKTSESLLLNSLVHDDVVSTNQNEFANIFNLFFTTLNSTSIASKDECDEYIDDVFIKLKRQGDIKTSNFTFTPITNSIVEKLLNNLDSKSGPGVSGLPSKVLKSAYSSITPSLTSLFNNCIASESIPTEFKIAVVTPIFKKGKPNESTTFAPSRCCRQLPNSSRKYLRHKSPYISTRTAYFFQASTAFAPITPANQLSMSCFRTSTK